MASGAERHFVYVRYWPGFTSSFPYERFNSLPDNEAIGAVSRSLIAELWEQWPAIRKRVQATQRKGIERRTKLRSIGAPSGEAHQPQRRPVKQRQSFCTRFARSASFVRWHDGSFARGRGGEWLYSPRVWLADVESRECGVSLVEYLAELVPANELEREYRRVFNPRFGCVACRDLPRGEQASVLASIQRLWYGGPVESLFDLARAFRPSINRFLVSWNATVPVKEDLTALELTEAQPAEQTSANDQPTIRWRKKRSTSNGDAEAKIISALTAHHKYANGSCENWEPIGSNELARQAMVGKATVSRFFEKQFGRGKYLAACADKTRLIHSLRMLNGELTPKILFAPHSDDAGV
jgi:hypothetical protein